MRKLLSVLCSLSCLIATAFGQTTSASTTSAAQLTNARDSQAIAIATQAIGAMGAAQAMSTYQDCLATGTLTAPGSSAGMPIVLKSKGTRMVRVELSKPKGTTIRILNNGIAVIQQPDGSVKKLSMNNTLVERVSHLPGLSLLAEYQDPNTSLEQRPAAKVNGVSTLVVAMRPLPAVANLTQKDFDQIFSKTNFYVDQSSGLVMKMSFAVSAENDPRAKSVVEIQFSGYRRVTGMLVPFRQTTYTDGQLESDLVLNSVTFNVGLSDSEFAVPQGGAQ